MSKVDFSRWTKVTSNLKAGEQRAFLDVLHLAADEKITLVYGQDYSADRKGACLVNQARNMLSATTNDETPTDAFTGLVRAFDSVCGRMSHDYSGTVTHTMALALIRNFGTLKELVVPVEPSEVDKPYRERKDADLLDDWLTAISQPPAVSESSSSATDALPADTVLPANSVVDKQIPVGEARD